MTDLTIRHADSAVNVSMGSDFNRALPDRLKAVGERMVQIDNARKMIAASELIFETYTAKLSGQSVDEPAIKDHLAQFSGDELEAELDDMYKDFVKDELAAWNAMEPKMGTIPQKIPSGGDGKIPSVERLRLKAQEAFDAYGENAKTRHGEDFVGPIVSYNMLYATLFDEALGMVRNDYNLKRAIWNAKRAVINPDADAFIVWCKAMAAKTVRRSYVRPSNRELKRRINQTVRRMKADGDIVGAAEFLGAAKNSAKPSKDNAAMLALMGSK